MNRSHERKSNRAIFLLALGFFVIASVIGTSIAPKALAEDKIVTLRGDPAAEAQEREQLFTALAAAKNAAEASGLAERIWSFWFRAPNAEAAALMEQIIDLRVARDYDGAVALLDGLVESEPEWAEAWNQRATMRYIQHDFEGSLADIERVLALEPKHFGALSGQAIILMHQGKMEAGQLALRKAVEIDPFLSERALLMKPTGQDI